LKKRKKKKKKGNKGNKVVTVEEMELFAECLPKEYKGKEAHDNSDFHYTQTKTQWRETPIA
jgi:hypothetical protein